MGLSPIEWTERTWNPTTGCTKISAGCKFCYAEVLSRRLQAMDTPGYENGFAISILPERLAQPLERQSPTVYFVNSMSDLFHKEIPFKFIDDVLATIWQTPHHTYQILTKRPKRMAQYFGTRRVPSNAWLGVTVENRRHGVPRIPILCTIKAEVRFLSVEPLLEDVGKLNLRGIHWVIVGGESGKKARPMEKKWAVSIRRQCKEKGIPFFFKQWGSLGKDGKHRGKKVNGRILDGKTWNEMPIKFVRTSGSRIVKS